MSLHTMFTSQTAHTNRPSRASRLAEALRLLPAHRVRAGSPVHPSLRHLAGDPELHRF